MPFMLGHLIDSPRAGCPVLPCSIAYILVLAIKTLQGPDSSKLPALPDSEVPLLSSVKKPLKN
jgi:hypothetical protein